MSARIEPLLTVEDLAALPDDGRRYEIIAGELHITGELQISHAPHFEHQVAVRNLSFEFMLYLKQNPIGIVIHEAGVMLTPFDAVIPDLIYISNERFNLIVENGRFTAAPELIIEVLSEGVEHERRDWQLKRQLYGKHGVREYWIVDWRKRIVAVHHQHAGALELVATLTEEDKLTSMLLPDFSLEVAKIFEI